MRGIPFARPSRFLALALFLFVLSADGLAQTGSIVHDPSELVKKYADLDVRGVRLDAISQETLAPYITWKDEPVWGHVVMIARYEVINDFKQWTVVSLSEVVIPVEYTVLGSLYWETASFIPEPRVERIGYRIKIVGDRWRIAEPILPPHVGQKRLINYVRQAILDEKDQAKAATLESLLSDLRKAKS